MQGRYHGINPKVLIILPPVNQPQSGLLSGMYCACVSGGFFQRRWECRRFKSSSSPVFRIWARPAGKRTSVHSHTGREKVGRWNEQSALQAVFKRCVMRRRTGTSALSALPVLLVAGKIYLSTNRKSHFLSLFFSQPCTMILKNVFPQSWLTA